MFGVSGTSATAWARWPKGWTATHGSKSILAGKKARPGIGALEGASSLTRQLAMSIGVDLGWGLGIGL